MSLSKEDVNFRRSFIGGSDATIIMSGDVEAINNLALVKMGRREPDDLSRVLPVQMGNWTEEHNLNWFEQETGRLVTHRQAQRFSLDEPFMVATLDGLTDDGKSVIDAKHVNAFAKPDEVLNKYYWQLQHNMFVCGLQRAFLSVFFGTLKWLSFEVHADPMQQEILIEAERSFWEAVKRGELPHVIPAAAAPVQAVRVADMGSSNSWADLAAIWLGTQKAAKDFDKAAKGIKELVEPDVKIAHGHGIEVTRNAAGSLSIKEKKQ